MAACAAACLFGGTAADVGADTAAGNQSITYAGSFSESASGDGGYSWSEKFTWSATASGSSAQLEAGDASYSLTVSGSISAVGTRGGTCSASVSGPAAGADLSSLFSVTNSGDEVQAYLGVLQDLLTVTVTAATEPDGEAGCVGDIDLRMLNTGSLDSQQSQAVATAFQPQATAGGATEFDASGSGSPLADSTDGSWTFSIQSTLTPPSGVYVALGDSFSSGDGAVAPDATEQDAYSDPKCHVTPDSYPRLLAPMVQSQLGESTLDLACSGARLEGAKGSNSIDEQAHRIPSDANLITLTAGGNDVGLFGRDMFKCWYTPLARLTKLLNVLRTRSCAKTIYVQSLDDYERLVPKLVTLYRFIHGQASTARLLVVGYPNPFPDTYEGGCLQAQGYIKHIPTRYFIALYRDDVHWFHLMVAHLDDAIETAINDVNYPDGWKPQYVDTQDEEFAGHDICSGSSWFWPVRLSPYPISSTLHPTIAGNEAIADLIEDDYVKTGG